jgi:hypothetical protein
MFVQTAVSYLVTVTSFVKLIVGDWLVCSQLFYLFVQCFDFDIMFLILFFDTVCCYTSRLSLVVLNTHNYILVSYYVRDKIKE